MNNKLSEEQIEIYYQNIREMLLDDDNFMDDYCDDEDMDDEEVQEEYVNREADKIFEKIFGFAR
jgi:hypothetical protein